MLGSIQCNIYKCQKNVIYIPQDGSQRILIRHQDLGVEMTLSITHMLIKNYFLLVMDRVMIF
jgi:hypothetical protein